MYLVVKIFLELLDMKSKKVYVYVIIVIWNFIRCHFGSRIVPRLPSGGKNRKRDGIWVPENEGGPGLNWGKRPTEIK
jgi:hypothetical protein